VSDKKPNDNYNYNYQQ